MSKATEQPFELADYKEELLKPYTMEEINAMLDKAKKEFVQKVKETESLTIRNP